MLALQALQHCWTSRMGIQWWTSPVRPPTSPSHSPLQAHVLGGQVLHKLFEPPSEMVQGAPQHWLARTLWAAGWWLRNIWPHESHHWTPLIKSCPEVCWFALVGALVAELWGFQQWGAYGRLGLVALGLNLGGAPA